MLRTVVFYLLFFPWTLLCILIALPASLLRTGLSHATGIVWGRHCLTIAGLRLTLKGKENIPAGPAIYVCNHQSFFDIPILYAGLPIQFRWMAKKELFNIPLFGLAMSRSGYIPIDRSDPRKAMHSLTQAAQKINAGSSVIIFPEGTRSYTGELLPFKKGAMLIAAKARVPVVPLVINGSYRAQPRGSFFVQRADLTLTVLPQVDTSTLKNRELDAFNEQLHSQMNAVLKTEERE